jgi:6-phosphogluconolactonase (cycloisomerase 2 family)
LVKNNDGSLTAAKQVVNHKGSSVNTREKEKKPHALHGVFSPEQRTKTA